MLLLNKKKEKKALRHDVHGQQRQKVSPYHFKGLPGQFLEFLKGWKENPGPCGFCFFFFSPSGTAELPLTPETQVSDGPSTRASSLSLKSTEFWSEVEVQGNPPTLQMSSFHITSYT